MSEIGKNRFGDAEGEPASPGHESNVGPSIALCLRKDCPSVVEFGGTVVLEFGATGDSLGDCSEGASGEMVFRGLTLEGFSEFTGAVGEELGYAIRVPPVEELPSLDRSKGGEK